MQDRVYKLVKTKRRERMGKLIGNRMGDLFIRRGRYNMTSALFYPDMYVILMPLNCLMLLRMVYPGITKWHDVFIQVGYENRVIMTHVRFPTGGSGVYFPLTSEEFGLEGMDKAEFDELFTDRELHKLF